LVIRPVPSQAARQRARALADSIANEIRNGADFAVAARRFSHDVASAQRGGDLDWFRRGVMVRPFEEVAFSLKRGTVSNPVETVFGYHIIQVQQIQPTEVKARHILIMPDLDSTDIARARALADSLRALVVAGASFDSLQVLYHDPSEEREAVGAIIDSLGPVYGAAINSVPDGGVTEVFALANEEGAPPKFAIVRVMERRPAGPAPYDQLRERIRQVLGESMGWQKYFDELRRKVHIEIRDP
jgi:peptidyl-prolyl cis-trans isomerase SurA